MSNKDDKERDDSYKGKDGAVFAIVNGMIQIIALPVKLITRGLTSSGEPRDKDEEE